MDFDRRKLGREDGSQLRPLKVDTMQPFALLPAPVYVFLPRNEKYVSVKGPLDFFSPEELTKFRESGSLFYPPFIDQVLPFRDAGVRCRAILSWQPVQRQQSATLGAKNIPLPPAPFEISDALLRIVGPLWGKDGQLEPFFTVPFAEELCESLPDQELAQARDANVDRFEEAVLVSSLAIFLAIHLGWSELAYLDRLRLKVFRGFVKSATSFQDSNPDVKALVEAASEVLRDSGLKPITQRWFDARSDRISNRIRSRLSKVFSELTKESGPAPSIFGERGFASG